MSTIGVKHHNEDIHNIIHKLASPTVKSPRYKSQKKLAISIEWSPKKKYNGHQTFGLAHYEAPQFKNYLKKAKPRTELPPVKITEKKEIKCTVGCKNAPLPKFTYESTKRIAKNYVKENIRRIASIKPKVPCPRRVDSPRGTVKDLAHLLQMIKIRQSEEYGQIPKYLCKRRKQWAKEKKRKEQHELAIEEYKHKMGIGSMGMSENVFMLDQEIRQKLLDGLKENWNELSKQFLKLPVMSDTLPKIRRKMWLETEIDQLEKDVKLVEAHPFIYLERSDVRTYEEIIAEESKLKDLEVKKSKERKEKEKDDDSTNQQMEQPGEEKKEDDEELNILNY